MSDKLRYGLWGAFVGFFIGGLFGSAPFGLWGGVVGSIVGMAIGVATMVLLNEAVLRLESSDPEAGGAEIDELESKPNQG